MTNKYKTVIQASLVSLALLSGCQNSTRDVRGKLTPDAQEILKSDYQTQQRVYEKTNQETTPTIPLYGIRF